MTKKSKDLDEGMAAEKAPTQAQLESARAGLAAAAGSVSAKYPNAWSADAARALLEALEQRCMDGGTANLDDIRAVLATLRG